jgi:hypothetical protein
MTVYEPKVNGKTMRGQCLKTGGQVDKQYQKEKLQAI